MVILCCSVREHPVALVATTLYVVVLFGFTIMEEVESPVFHAKVAPSDTVNTWFTPEQLSVSPKIVGVKSATVIV